MILDSTDSITFFISGNTLSTQMPFVVSYNDIGTSSMTPFEANGVSNNSTNVTMVSSPSSGFKRQVTEMSIYNPAYLTGASIFINFYNGSQYYNLFCAQLKRGETLQYNINNGWAVLDTFGNKKTESIHIYPSGGIRMAELLVLPGAATSTAVGTTHLVWSYMGKAEWSYSSITFAYNITVAPATITWAEMGVYRVGQPMGLGTQQVLQRVGVINATTPWTGTGLRYTNVPTSGIKKGDDLYFVVGNVATTSVAFRGGGISEPLLSILHSINSSASTWRPTTTETMIATTFQGAACDFWFAWQGYGDRRYNFGFE